MKKSRDDFYMDIYISTYMHHIFRIKTMCIGNIIYLKFANIEYINSLRSIQTS